LSINNITSKSLDITRKMVEKAIDLKQQHGINVAPLLWGIQGIGKTQTIYQIAKERDYEVSVINAASTSPEDLMGSFNLKTGGYNKPDWIIESEKPVVYFLDELNRGPKYVLQSMFNLINEGRYGNWKIKDTDVVIAAANPSDLFEVTSFEDPAFLSRFMHIKMQPEMKEFNSFLGSAVKNTIIQETLKKTVNIYQDHDFDIGFQVTPDNRKLHKVAVMLDVMSDQEIQDIGIYMFESMLGFEASSAILETWRESKKNVHDPKKVLTTKPKDYNFDFEDVDVLNTINTKMVALIKEKTLTKRQQEGFVDYVNFMPKDLALAFLKEVVHINEDLVDLLDSEWGMRLLNMNND
jgi:hypothetical protein